MTTPYQDFLRAKAPSVAHCGVEVGAVNRHLFPWQAQLVRWALRLGRAALFADCGLGKTLMQLSWADEVHKATGGRVLILAPLAVAGQTVREGERFGVRVSYARFQAEVTGDITVTNYERLEHFDVGAFEGVVLDESSILKSFAGKTKRALVESFRGTRFRLACTATPSPNDVMELGNHAEFLGVMESGEMLMRWFINDTMTAGKYRLKAHAEADYWRWVASWAACLSSPQDLLDSDGKPYSSRGYKLPGLRVVEHVVEGPPLEPEAGELVSVPSLTATSMHREMRRTTAERAARAADLIAREPDESWVLWCNTDYEADALLEAVPEALEVRGSHKAETKEERLASFSEGRANILISKPSLAGFGLNWQHCARMSFVGLSYSYEAFYQALRRSYRFGQKREVVAHVICARSEAGIRNTVARKQVEHRRLQERMLEAQRITQQAELAESRAVGIASGTQVVRVPSWLTAPAKLEEVA